MKKSLALLTAFLILLASCSFSLAETVNTQKPETSDLLPLLSMTRAEVEELYGTGEASPFADISDYYESAYELDGFPYLYSNLNGVMVFYDAVALAKDAVPYGCVESPDDRVAGIMLQPDSALFNACGYQAELNTEAIAKRGNNFGAKIEHINGLYEYYRFQIEDAGIKYVWNSDFDDMSNSALYASLAAQK